MSNMYFEEVEAKVGGAIDNCGYLDAETVEALVKLAAEESQRQGVTPEQFRAWAEKYTWASPPISTELKEKT